MTMPNVGDLIDKRYRLVGILGMGGMGSVFEAEDTALDRRIAIKFLAPDFARTPEMRARFRREARAAATIAHPGIVTVHDIGELPDGQLYIAMERLTGETLDIRTARKPLRDDEALLVLRDTALAVYRAHERGIVHRDLKPSNIFLVDEPAGSIVKVVDFGIAKLSSEFGDESGVKTGTGMLMGSPAYMAPEQARGDPVVGPSLDIYALGIIAFELFSGQKPFEGSSPMQLITARLIEPAPRLSTVRADLPGILDDLVAQMLAMKPVDRPKSMGYIARRLDAIHSAFATGGTATSVMAVAPITARKKIAAKEAPPKVPDPPMQAKAVGRTASFESFAEPNRDQAGSALGAGPVADKTVLFALSTGAEASKERPKPDKDPFQSLSRALPGSLTSMLPELRMFLSAIAESCEHVADRAVRLHTPRIKGGDKYAFFAVFIESSPQSRKANELGERTFVGSAEPLEVHLAKLGRDLPKVVVALVDAEQLGRGARKHIVQFGASDKATVVPLLLSEVKHALRRQRALRVFEERLAEFHTRRDPFDPFHPSGPSRDPNRFYGLKSELNTLTSALEKGPAIVCVSGAPGAGKTSLVLRAEHDLGDMRLITVPCRQLLDRTPSALADEIERALAATGSSPSAPPPPITPENTDQAQGERTILERIQSASTTASGGSPSDQDRILLVLEDADDLVDALCEPKSDDPQSQKGRELWITLVRAVTSGLLSAVVTGFRTSLLAERTLAGWQNPAFGIIHRVTLQPLSRADTERLVEEIGFEANISFTPNAIAAVHRIAGGNVDFTRRLCSAALEIEKDARGPLETVSVPESHVVLAAEHLESRPDTISAFKPSLRPIDERVLRVVHDERPRSAQQVESILGQSSKGQAANSLTRLESMGLIGLQKKRYEVRIPLVAGWVRSTVPRLPSAVSAARARKIVYATVGIGLTVLAVSAYIAWFRDKSLRSDIVTADGCRYMALHPERGTKDERLSVVVWRECDGPAAGRKVALVPAMGTAAKVGDTLSGVADVLPCTPSNECRTVSVPVTLLSPLDGKYELQLRLDSDVLMRLYILDDPFAKLKRTLDSAFRIATAVPALLGLVGAFFSDITGLLRRTLSSVRGDREPRSDKKPDDAG